MEPRAGPETQRPEIQTQDRLRATQREKILHDHIKNPSARELLGALIPSDRPMHQTQVNANRLREFAGLLGKDTHTVLFGLAATSNYPNELQNILMNIANLRNIDTSYWNRDESEDHFLRRPLSEHINVSEGAEIQADPTPADKDLYGLLLSRLRPNINVMRNDPRYALESLLYTISAENIPLEEKRRVLNDLYSGKTIISAPSGNKDRQKIYGSDSSFWSHVDGSWIYPGDATDRLGRLTSTIKKRVSKRVLLPVSILGLALASHHAIHNLNIHAPNIKEPTPAAAPLPDFTSQNTHVLQPYTPQPATEISPTVMPTPEPIPTPEPTPQPTSTPRPTPTQEPTRIPVPTRPPEATQMPVKLPIPTIQPTKAPTPKPEEEKNKWTRTWAPNETVSVQEWWNDMVAKGYISIDAIAQQYVGKEINNFLATANLVPNPVKYGYGGGPSYINECKDELDKFVRQGQGHIQITPDAYAQIPGGVKKCQIFTKSK